MSPFLIALLAFAALAFIFMGFILISRLAEGLRDNRLPIQSGPAAVAGIRLFGRENRSTSIGYVSFDMPDGSRQQFEMHIRDTALVAELVEGERGTLTWQGTRFKAFVRPAVRQEFPSPLPNRSAS